MEEKVFSWEKYEELKMSMESEDWFSLMLYYSEGKWNVESAMLEGEIEKSDVEKVFKIGSANTHFLTTRAEEFLWYFNNSEDGGH